MKVTLIDYTKDALEMLIFSKNTRVSMDKAHFDAIKQLTPEQKAKELTYIFGTINSSWEFVDYTFLIEDVTRAFTHQLTRHRVGVSFAQQAMRVIDASDFEYLATGKTKQDSAYRDAMEFIRSSYKEMISQGINPQDARGILPTNVLTSILMKINLRALSEMLAIRLCVKAQGEFQEVARSLRQTAIMVHPWAEPILQVRCVLSGSCAFPSYENCPIKKLGLLPTVSTNTIKAYWEEHRVEVQPTSSSIFNAK